MTWTAVIATTLVLTLGPMTVVYCLAAIGLNIHFGYTGLLNFGQAAFMMASAYALGSFIATWGLGMMTGIAAGVFFAVLLALALGVPTLRLRADYLAIVTIAAAEVIRIVLGSLSLSNYFHGQDGLYGYRNWWNSINPFSSPMGVTIGSLKVAWKPDEFFVMVVGWVLVAVCCVLVWLLMRSPWGRVLKSIREDEDAVRSLGKNVFQYKMQALVLGGVIGGLAGFIRALYANIAPSDFATDTTFFAWTVLLLGGAARVLGPVVGALIFQLFIEGLAVVFEKLTAGPDPTIPTWLMDANQASLMRFIFMGLALMLLMIFRPQGIFGDRKELAIDAR